MLSVVIRALRIAHLPGNNRFKALPEQFAATLRLKSDGSHPSVVARHRAAGIFATRRHRGASESNLVHRLRRPNCVRRTSADGTSAYTSVRPRCQTPRSTEPIAALVHITPGGNLPLLCRFSAYDPVCRPAVPAVLTAAHFHRLAWIARRRLTQLHTQIFHLLDPTAAVVILRCQSIELIEQAFRRRPIRRGNGFRPLLFGPMLRLLCIAACVVAGSFRDLFR